MRILSVVLVALAVACSNATSPIGQPTRYAVTDSIDGYGTRYPAGGVLSVNSDSTWSLSIGADVESGRWTNGVDSFSGELELYDTTRLRSRWLVPDGTTYIVTTPTHAAQFLLRRE